MIRHLAFCSLAVAALTGCGGSQPAPRDARGELAAAKAKVDASPALHFALSSENAGGSDVYIQGGQGDAARPDGFSGSFDVFYRIGVVKIGVASVGGTFYVRLPFGSGWTVATPSDYGFSDPGHLIDPTSGLSNLLTAATTATADGEDRYNGEQLREVKVTLPGTLVQQLLTSADPAQPVQGEIGIAGNGEPRRVRLTGPFFAKGRESTYTVIVSGYGEHVTVTPPPS